MSEIKPPYVKFETRPLEDREATIAAGHYVARDVDFAIITPPGTKDELEKEADAWLHDTKRAVDEGRVPEGWLAHYKSLYAAYREGIELPESGTPIRTWPVLSPAEIANVLAANIRTVEDLATATETALQYIGMGGHALRDRAQAYLETAAKTGKPAEELAKLRKQIEASDRQREADAKTIAALTARVEELEEAA